MNAATRAFSRAGHRTTRHVQGCKYTRLVLRERAYILHTSMHGRPHYRKYVYANFRTQITHTQRSGTRLHVRAISNVHVQSNPYARAYMYNAAACGRTCARARARQLIHKCIKMRACACTALLYVCIRMRMRVYACMRVPVHACAHAHEGARAYSDPLARLMRLLVHVCTRYAHSFLFQFQ